MNKEELIKKYYEGKTTLKEEEWLGKQNWLDGFVAEQELFSDLKLQRKDLTPSVSKTKVKQLLPFIAAFTTAACIVFLIWVNIPNSLITENNSLKSQILVDASLSGEITDEELALAQTKKALAFLNSKIKKGTQEMKHLKTINNSINKIK